MPYIFFEVDTLKEVREVIFEQVKACEAKLQSKKELWNNLNGVIESTETPDKLNNFNPQTIVADTREKMSHIETDLKCPEKLKGLAKEAMNGHNHIHGNETPGGYDGRVQPGQKSQAEINPVPQSSDGSAPGSHDPMLKIAKRALETNCKEENETKPAQAETAKDPQIETPFPALTKADLTIPKFEHDKTQEKSFRTLFYLEMPDGRVMLKYMQGLTYVLKEKILQLPFPIVNGYFKNAGFNAASHVTAIRLYRELLFVQDNEKKLTENTAKPSSSYVGKSSRDRILETQEQKHKQEAEMEAQKPAISKEDIAKKYSKILDVEDPDRKYKPFGLNQTRVGKEDYDQVQGELQ